jgi:prevent-host-death family protein
MERRVGIRELKSKLSECVREVRHGGTIVVTDHGEAVARLIPELDSFVERTEMLGNSGMVLWSGRRLRRSRPQARTRGKRTVADMVVENRK